MTQTKDPFLLGLMLQYGKKQNQCTKSDLVMIVEGVLPAGGLELSWAI